MRTSFRLIGMGLFLFIALAPYAGRASGVFFQPSSRALPVGVAFEVGVLLDTEGERINAVEGTVSFPEGIALEQIRDGGSRVPLWVERPKVVSPGVIRFSGVIPGGYDGTEGELFRLVFRPASEGETVVLLGDLHLLLDDGLGTETAARAGSFVLTASPPIYSRERAEVKDLIPPAPFEPTIVRDPSLFNGDWFVLFATQDKGFGLAHYDLLETRYPFLQAFVPWERAESPFRLRDQTRSRWVLVRATDLSGNKRVMQIPPVNTIPWFKQSMIWAILIGVTGVAVLLSFALRRRSLS